MRTANLNSRSPSPQNQYGANVNDAYKTTLTTTTDEGTTTEPGNLTVSGGTTDFKLKHGQILRIEGLPVGTGYTVAETVPTEDGYTVVKTGDEGTIDKDTPAAATFTNTRNIGGFTVTKVEEGNGFEEGYPNTQDAYDITVTLTPPTGVTLVGYVNGTALSAAGTVTEGVWSKTFSLKAGESAVFTDLPEDTTYTISEAGYTNLGYEEAQLTSTGTVTPGTTDDGLKYITGTIPGEEGANSVAVTVTNERNVGSLSVEKIVDGTGVEPKKDFTFTLQLTNNGVKLDGDYPATINGTDTDTTDTTVAVDAFGKATFTLKGGESITIDGIPEGTTYEVTEAPYASEGYETESDYKDATRTIGDGTTDEVTFTNTRNVGGFTLTKKTDGNGLDEPDVRKEFGITVTLTAPTGVQLVGTVDGKDLTEVAAIENGVWEHTFTLKNGEKVVFAELPEGTRYTIVEANDGYASEGFIDMLDDPGNGVITVAENAIEAPDVAVTLTNTRNVGGLTIVKKVTGSGSATNDTFTFRLELKNENGVNVNGEYYMLRTGESAELLPVANGEAVITLRGNQSAFIDGIPLGTKYTVTERATDLEGNNVDAQQGDAYANGFALTSENGLSGTITSEDGSYVAEFTNHRDVGSLKITKNVEGNGEDAPNALTEFDVTVALTAPTGVALTGTWTQGEESGNVSASNTFTLTDGESVELTGLPAGTTYTITEESYAANGYESDIEPEEGEITDGATAVTVTNTMNVGDLRVTKTVNGTGAEADREFEFTLTLDNADGVIVDNTYETSEGTLTVENGEATFTLKDGETLTVYGIPEGTDYTVSEADPAGHGYLITAVSGEEGVIRTGTSSASFTNTRDIGELSVEKTVAGAIGETDKAFAFTLKLIPSGNGIDVDGVYNATLYTADAAQSATVTVANGVANFTLTHDQRLVIHEIPAGATYEVTEASYALEGYQTEASGERGTIPATGVMPVASFTNTRDAGNLRIEKVFAGNGPIAGDAFTFTIRLSRTDGVDVNGVYAALLNGEATQVAFTGGAATVALTGGDALEILDILSGTTYEVSEEIPDGSGYTGASENETGVIPVGATAATTFTNERNVGNLIVRKAVAGNAAETDRNFDFTIFLREPDGTNANGSYRMTGDAGSSITFVNGYASLSLAAGEEAVIQGILDGAYYDVREDDADTDGYVTTSSATAGLISAADDALVSFLNTRNVTAEVTSRTVYKVWNDENDADGLRPDELIVYLLADGDSVAAATLNEANGWSAVFDDLPVYNADGTQIGYEVVEAYTAEYYVRYQYTQTAINITNTHNPDDFTPRTPDDPALLTLIEDNMVPLGGNINMNEGDCFN